MSEKTFQAEATALFVGACDGDPSDIAERVARFGEEAIEVMQTCGMTAAEMHRLVDYVCARPIGSPLTEIGQAHFTLALLASYLDADLLACARRELDRFAQPERLAKFRAKRSTRHGRGALPGIDPAEATQ